MRSHSSPRRSALLAGLLVTLVPPARGQEQLAKLLPPELDKIARFASSVAVGHGRILASDHTADEDRGRVHVFDLETGAHLAVLRSREPWPKDYFGSRIVIGERWVLIASRKATATDYHSGAVHVFDPVTWKEVAKITAPDGNKTQSFGNDIAIQGDLALIGAPDDDTIDKWAGAAYLVDLPTGTLVRKLFGSDTAYHHYFGCCVALAGDRALVTAGWIDSHTGATYVFDLTTGQELMKLQGSNTHPEASFGYPLAAHGKQVLIGASGEDDKGLDHSGAAYLFDLETGVELRRFSSPQPTEFSGFGTGLYLDGRRVWIGHPGNLTFLTELGHVHVYDLATGNHEGTFEPADNAVGDAFGFPIARDGCRMVVGSVEDDDFGKASGSAYLFRVTGELGASYCGPASLNSTGLSAELRGEGAPCALENHLELTARQVPPDQFGTLLASRTQGFVPFAGGSQGHLCLAGDVARLTDQVAFSGAAGELSFAVDLSAVPTNPPQTVQPGQTWSFQCWFRDRNPGPTSNFTDGLAITFE